MSLPRKILLAIGALIILIGMVGLAYPVIGNYINQQNRRAVIWNYMDKVKDIDEENAAKMLKEAKQYNKKLFQSVDTIADLGEENSEQYKSILDIDETGMMGYIHIPKIGEDIPIYHGTSEDVLQVGAGHLAGSSFPVGGKNTHCVITGHSGLPSSKLFTDLDKLQAGDTILITVLDRTVTYEVDYSEILLPKQVKLNIEEGQDLCTLITCTPIGVNTHRLLVHAHRVPNAPVTEETASTVQKTDHSAYIRYIGIGAGIAAVLIVLLFVRRFRRKRR